MLQGSLFEGKLLHFSFLGEKRNPFAGCMFYTHPKTTEFRPHYLCVFGLLQSRKCLLINAEFITDHKHPSAPLLLIVAQTAQVLWKSEGVLYSYTSRIIYFYSRKSDILFVFSLPGVQCNLKRPNPITSGGDMGVWSAWFLGRIFPIHYYRMICADGLGSRIWHFIGPDVLLWYDVTFLGMHCHWV